VRNRRNFEAAGQERPSTIQRIFTDDSAPRISSQFAADIAV
jgi:hypothetical protein